MKNTDSRNRWYDKDPTVSIAVSILRNTSTRNQKLVSELIIEKGISHNIDIEIDSHKKFGFFLRRWYDQDEKLYNALEYLRLAPLSLQKEFAIDIINYLCILDGELSKDCV